jgi:DnaJ-class molecular chaperone
MEGESMTDYSKHWPCRECGEMVMSTEKHTFNDCESWKAKVRSGLRVCPRCKGKGFIEKEKKKEVR